MKSRNPGDAARPAAGSIRLGRIARARSGDKGTGSNVGVMVDSDAAYRFLRDELTAGRVAGYFGPMGATAVDRYELPNLRAFNFVIKGILSRGTRVDAQGKALGQAILEMPIDLPAGGLPVDSIGGAMSESILKVESPREGVVELVLNRPERRNALSVALMGELCDAIADCSRDPSNRALILRGEGRGFCSGLDLHEASDPATAGPGADGIGRVLDALGDTPLITIAGAHGYAYAGGAGLMAACDFAVAAEGLKIGFPEVRRGLVPALVANILRKKLKDADLRELLLLAEPVDVDRARSMGLIHRVVPEDRVLKECLAIAELILRGGPQAVRNTKAMLADFQSSARFEGSRIAHEYHIQARTGREASEGLSAFLEKREPHWT